jgi:phospholipid/cholesterol/gamma-HCH transport system substrate-binding protein
VKVETKVGLLFVSAVAMVAAFAWYLGSFNPFASNNEVWVAYNFAGGVEVGSPVRVMGIKVGKVSAIEFAPNLTAPNGEEVKLRLKISINKDAWPTVRQDSRFFINLAGVIGEKFIEITPGSAKSPELTPGAFVRGEDPPRIDQLISQSYGLAGKILDMVEKNEGSVADTLDKMNSLVTNLNKTLDLFDRVSKNKETSRIIGNVTQITEDLTILTSRLRGPEAEKTLDLLHRLLWRLDKLDENSIRTFLQKEGIKAKIF